MAWWWTQIYLMYKRVKGILEASALDVDEMLCPKEYWFDDALLKEWFDSRKAEQKRRMQEDAP